MLGHGHTRMGYKSLESAAAGTHGSRRESVKKFREQPKKKEKAK